MLSHILNHEATGIRQPSQLMMDRVTTVPRAKLGESSVIEWVGAGRAHFVTTPRGNAEVSLTG